DDWMAPHRISYQTEALLRQGAEVCGIQRMLFYEQSSGYVWLYEYPESQRPWLAGGSLLYTRDFWKKSPFPSVQVAEDTLFVWEHQMERRVALPDFRFYVAMIHPGNNSPKKCDGVYWSRWQGDLQSIMGNDLNFYKIMSQGADSDPKRISGTKRNTVLPAAQAILSTQVKEDTSEDSKNAGKIHTGPCHAAEIQSGSASETPLISCVIATHDRPGFLRQAIRCFLRQTYEQSELIVVDDGDQSVEELCAGLYRVRYIRLNNLTSLGSKLNIGIRHAQGSIIQKIDDDDYYHSDFLKKAVGALLAEDQESTLVAWDCFLILLAGERQTRYSGHGWAAGGTLCFNRILWDRCHFRDIPSQVDTCFIADHKPRIIKICAPELYILVRHGFNTWNQLSNGDGVDPYFKRLPVYHKLLDDLVEPLDQMFYQSLTKKGA
ncbi:MAG: glycosyltransferase, partial [Deltaproteobacteria bacterium]|nr:glycosyltransferase [Deltaproteobacteria bacterium]